MTHAHIQEVGSPLINEEHTRLLMQVAKSVGRKFAFKYPALDAEDIASEVTRLALEQWKHYEVQLKRAKDFDRPEYQVLHYLLSLKASEYCGRQYYEYMANTATVLYTPAEVRALLKEYYFNPDAWEAPQRDDNFGVSVEAKSLWANLADIKSALDRVSTKVYETVLAAFGPEDLVTATPDKRRVSEAVAAVTREMNLHLNQPSSHEGPGRRKAMSNQAAISAIRNQ